MGFRLRVSPTVFHPGFFISSSLLAGELATMPLRGLKTLDLGCGSGLLALQCARQGAEAWATDVNEAAIADTQFNAAANNLAVNTRQGSLFTPLAGQQFHVVVVNPPYYPRRATNATEQAWNCGPHFEYFSELFAQLPNHSYDGAVVLMSLSTDCDIARIKSLALKAGLRWRHRTRYPHWFEEHFVFELQLG